VATTKEIYLEEDIFYPQKESHDPKKNPQQKAHLRPSVLHKITQPQNSNNNTPASLTTKSHSHKTKTTTHLLFYPQNTEPKTKTTTHLPHYPQKKKRTLKLQQQQQSCHSTHKTKNPKTQQQHS
jgi:hypothetical protein